MQTFSLSQVLANLSTGSQTNQLPNFFNISSRVESTLYKASHIRDTNTCNIIRTTRLAENMAQFPLEPKCAKHSDPVDPTGDYGVYKITRAEVDGKRYFLHMETKNMLINDSDTMALADSQKDKLNLRACFATRFIVVFKVRANGTIYLENVERSRNYIPVLGEYKYEGQDVSYAAFGYHHVGSSLCQGTWTLNFENMISNAEHIPFQMFMNVVINALISRNDEDSAGRYDRRYMQISTLNGRCTNAELLKRVCKLALEPDETNVMLYSWGGVTTEQVQERAEYLCDNFNDIIENRILRSFD